MSKEVKLVNIMDITANPLYLDGPLFGWEEVGNACASLASATDLSNQSVIKSLAPGANVPRNTST